MRYLRGALIALAIGSAMPAQAQTPTNRAALDAAVNNSFPTNGQQFITAAVLRGFLDTLIASITAIYQDQNVIPNTTLAQMPATTVKANVTNGTANASDVSLTSFFGSAPMNSIPADAVIGASLGSDGGFTPTPAYAGLSVTSSSSRVPLPTGTSIIVYNTGSNAAYVLLGNSSVTATLSNDVIQPNSWLEFVVGANTNIAGITSTGSTNLVISGGSGLAAGAGGGGGSSGGTGLSVTDQAAFTAGSSPFTPSGGQYNLSPQTLTSGQSGMLALGSTRHVLTTEDNSSAMASTLTSINTAVNASIPAGTNSIGTVGLNAGSQVVGTVNTVTTNNGNSVPHICGNHVFKHITSATDTQAVAASGSTTIYVCDYSFSFGGAGNFYLEKATSGTCATLTQLTGTWYGSINVGKIDANPYYRGLNTGSSAQLCINTSSFTGPLDIDIYYDQY